jgi:hypothetical protein
VERPPIHRTCMPHRSDQRVQIEVVDELCGVMVSHGVVPALVRDILQVTELSTIWTTLPHVMTSLMSHLISVINLIKSLRGLAHTAHDSTPSRSSSYMLSPTSMDN